MEALAFVPIDNIEDVYLSLVDEATILLTDKVCQKVHKLKQGRKKNLFN